MARQCNIDARGKVARFTAGMISVLAGSILAAGMLFGMIQEPVTWFAIAGMYAGGAFAIYEARAGWCIVRAMGIRTPL
ncbi:MAG: hypothetical protein L7S56_05370 [Candidatus Poseidonia sp.]|nr:hypothetical protein [Poseidonia sp.]